MIAATILVSVFEMINPSAGMFSTVRRKGLIS